MDVGSRWRAKSMPARIRAVDQSRVAVASGVGASGAWKPNLTLGDKVYCCDRCGVRIHRDTANGARNNFFAALSKAMGVPPDATSA